MIVFDCETDGLLDKATKIHVLSWTDNGEDFHSIYDYDEMRSFLNNNNWFMCHNGIRFDAQIFKKILDVDMTGKVFDTLALSWYINHERTESHGLAVYGEELGVSKPEIEDWENLTREDYTHRCEEDVKINWLLWKQLQRKMEKLYKDKANMFKFMKYLSFKMECAAEQERLGWRLDVPRVESNIKKLESLVEEKKLELSKVMPLVPVYKKKSPPVNPLKKDGTLSVHGQKWQDILEMEGLPKDHNEEVELLDGFKPPNPGSNDQIKKWLSDLGWEPCYYKTAKTTKGKINEVPQVRVDGELAKSVKLLIEKEPKVEVLEGLTVLEHRLSFFKAMYEDQTDGWLQATVHGLTNTLRFKHARPLANIPGVDSPWGEEIRSCLIAPSDEEILCGSDMSSLESTTKRHYMYPLDPEYVKVMSEPDFDEHLDLAVQAGDLSQEDYKWYTTDGSDPVRKKTIKSIRSDFKPVNYGAVYGQGAPRLSKETGMSVSRARKLLDKYWERNWAVKELVKDLKIRFINGSMWLQNPVSGFWYSLRYEKDKFSTLNQGTGVFCFDTWLAFARAMGVKTCGQFHDEYIGPISKEDQEHNSKVLRLAIDRTNAKLKLNVKLDIDVQYGHTYAEIH